MTYIERTTVLGIRCDKPGCTRTCQGAEFNYFEGHKVYDERAATRGWSRWVGRMLRHYCPDHGPSKGNSRTRHPMRQVY